MTTVRLGKSGLVSPRNAFGALPIQRISDADAVAILHRAYEGGMTFFDTARFYTDSEHKLGLAFSHMRDKVVIASKTGAVTVEDFWRDLETSLSELQTSYIDLYQFHNPAFCPKPNDGTGLYEAMLQARAEGKIRHIGITNHRLHVAEEAVLSGLYETLQFPFSYLAGESDHALVALCAEHDVGFIAMKALSGGLITDAAAAYAYIAQYPHVLPIWGIQRLSELEEFLRMSDDEPTMTDEMRARIERDRAQLGGDFCRGCGYCMPCPVGIRINDCARMSQLIRRSPSGPQLTDKVRADMEHIEACVGCGSCKSKCPYGLDIPALLRRNLEDYRRIVRGEIQL
ncbi:MAG: aldo/keto reductase [Clostridia bacterium]|nr:aldo/keto reductase [Clostridia bacterium]